MPQLDPIDVIELMVDLAVNDVVGNAPGRFRQPHAHAAERQGACRLRKPGRRANIFLARDDDDEIVKVLDFGIAKLTGTRRRRATTTGTVLGSPHYMSPEQARGGQGGRSPQRSLVARASSLPRASPARSPSPATSSATCIIAICAEPIPRASALAPDLGPEVDRFFARALARDPDARWQTARSSPTRSPSSRRRPRRSRCPPRRPRSPPPVHPPSRSTSPRRIRDARARPGPRSARLPRGRMSRCRRRSSRRA